MFEYLLRIFRSLYTPTYLYTLLRILCSLYRPYTKCFLYTYIQYEWFDYIRRRVLCVARGNVSGIKAPTKHTIVRCTTDPGNNICLMRWHDIFVCVSEWRSSLQGVRIFIFTFSLLYTHTYCFLECFYI